MRVYDTRTEMQDAVNVYTREATGNYNDAGAVTVSRPGWEDRDPRPFQATIFFSREDLDLTVISHEATHAAAHIYGIDCYRDHARATAHLNISNERLAYLQSDIFRLIVYNFEIIPIGDAPMAGAEES